MLKKLLFRFKFHLVLDEYLEVLLTHWEGDEDHKRKTNNPNNNTTLEIWVFDNFKHEYDKSWPKIKKIKCLMVYRAKFVIKGGIKDIVVWHNGWSCKEGHSQNPLIANKDKKKLNNNFINNKPNLSCGITFC